MIDDNINLSIGPVQSLSNSIVLAFATQTKLGPSLPKLLDAGIDAYLVEKFRSTNSSSSSPLFPRPSSKFSE